MALEVRTLLWQLFPYWYSVKGCLQILYLNSPSVVLLVKWAVARDFCQVIVCEKTLEQVMFRRKKEQLSFISTECFDGTNSLAPMTTFEFLCGLFLVLITGNELQISERQCENRVSHLRWQPIGRAVRRLSLALIHSVDELKWRLSRRAAKTVQVSKLRILILSGLSVKFRRVYVMLSTVFVYVTKRQILMWLWMNVAGVCW